MKMENNSVANAKAMLSIKYGKTAIKIDTKRLLTSGEIALAQLIFGNSIDYSKIFIRRGGLGGIPDATKNAMTPFGEIHLPEESYLKIKDFSLSKEASDKIWFIHEMTHVWQHQLGFNNFGTGIIIGLKGGYTLESKAYDYDLLYNDQNKKFSEFNMEQQGEIVSHYFDAVYLSNVNHDLPKQHANNKNQLTALKKVLIPFFNNPTDKNLLPNNYGKIFWHTPK